jgi:hypothetical protein
MDEGRFLPGTLLAQRYRVVSLLGRGGMGEVYRANDLLLGQTVALKFLPAQWTSHEATLVRFRNEVRIVQRSVPGCTVRPAQLADVEVCDMVSRQVHGFSRTVELAETIQQGTATVVEREGRITGYATVLGFFGHATAETNLDLEALIASVDSFGGPGILVPSQNSGLFRWWWLRSTRPLEQRRTSGGKARWPRSKPTGAALRNESGSLWRCIAEFAASPNSCKSRGYIRLQSKIACMECWRNAEL